ncbi:PSMC3 interacting protein [Marasmius tenuissimus]|uniref:PSMC3 interacting protein n=1 Tax=Marasmius tenuissimus TaxID=585030 RepID=A0ABR3AGP8_9AGAR|nr:PSMC3 interacting protein [Marasmius tenuissimus]
MATKQKTDVKVLKGQEAEDKVLEYVKMMNRPYGAVDVSANLKGVVPKAATQKILVALAEKGELVQKTYGKTTFFVANQSKIETLPAEQIAIVEAEHKKIDEGNKHLVTQSKALGGELAKLKNTPSDTELGNQITQTRDAIDKRLALLKPLRSGAQLISAESLAQVDADWAKWRAEWVRRKKIFMSFWQLVTDSLSPQDAERLSEDLGIEFDTTEHVSVEHGPLCANPHPPKRKR